MDLVSHRGATLRQLELRMMHFQSLQIKKKLKFSSKKFLNAFTIKRYAKTKTKFFSPMSQSQCDSALIVGEFEKQFSKNYAR